MGARKIHVIITAANSAPAHHLGTVINIIVVTLHCPALAAPIRLPTMKNGGAMSKRICNTGLSENIFLFHFTHKPLTRIYLLTIQKSIIISKLERYVLHFECLRFSCRLRDTYIGWIIMKIYQQFR